MSDIRVEKKPFGKFKLSALSERGAEWLRPWVVEGAVRVMPIIYMKRDTWWNQKFMQQMKGAGLSVEDLRKSGNGTG